MSAALAPLCAFLVGIAFMQRIGTTFDSLGRFGAAMIMGPILTSVFLFAAYEVGVSVGAPLAWSILIGAAALSVFGFRNRAGRAAFGIDLGLGTLGIVSAALVLFTDCLVRALSRPLPEGDGMLNFAFKARCFFLTGEIWPLLQDERVSALHPDYPLCVPMIMNLGHAFAGNVSGIHEISTSLMVIPGLVLLVGSEARKSWGLWGVVAAWLMVLIPAATAFVVAGYAEPYLMALLTLAACSLSKGEKGAGLGAIAAGFLPWVKLEGLVLFGLLGGAVVLCRLFSPRRVVQMTLVAVPLAAFWPLLLMKHDLLLPVGEHTQSSLTFEHASGVLRSFANCFWSTEEIHGLFWFPILIGCVLLLIQGAPRGQKMMATMVIITVLTAPLLVFFRQTNLTHLSQVGGVGARYLSAVLPLGLLCLGLSLRIALTKNSR